MSSSRDLVHILRIIRYGQLIADRLQGVNLATFLDDPMLQHGAAHIIEQIGEETNKLAESFRSSHAGIDWAGIVGMRNVLVHAYTEARPDLVYNSCLNELPVVVAALQGLIAIEAPEEE